MFGVSLDRIASILDRLQSPALQVSPYQCSRLRHRRSTCRRCADACPTQAIMYRDGLVVESDKCIDCGVCATVCPTGALEAQAPANANLLGQFKARLDETRDVAFACPRYLQGQNAPGAPVVQVKCLGRLDEAILLGLVAEGAAGITLLDHACAGCPYAVGRTIAAGTVQRTNALLAAFGVQGRVVFDSAAPAPGQAGSASALPAEGLSRRAFLDYFRRESVKATALTVSTVLSAQPAVPAVDRKLPRGGLPARVPAKHQLLLSALRKIGKPATSAWDGGIWSRFRPTEKCNGCQMCAFFCPTGALVKIEQEGKLGVAFRSALCTDCRLCEELCYLKGAALSPAIDLDEVVDDAVETLLMVDAAAAPWKLAPTDL